MADPKDTTSPAAIIAATAPVTADDQFEAAFSALTLPEDTPVVVKKEEETPAVATTETATETAAAAGLPDPATLNADGTVKTTEAPALTAEEIAAAAKAVTDAAANTPEARAAETAAAQKRTEEDTMLHRLAEMISKEKPTEVKTPVAEPSPVTPYTKEEQDLITAYETEWPEIARAEQLVRQREYQALTSYIFAEVLKAIQPIQQQTLSTAQLTHAQQLQAAVPDIEAISPALRAWIDEQPDFLKEAYTKVANTGAVGQIKTMVDRFRVDKKVAAPVPAAPGLVVARTAEEIAAAALRTVRQPAAVDPAKAAAIASLAPVDSKRSGANPSGTVDAGDFDGAFDAFAHAAL